MFDLSIEVSKLFFKIEVRSFDVKLHISQAKPVKNICIMSYNLSVMNEIHKEVIKQAQMYQQFYY